MTPTPSVAFFNSSNISVCRPLKPVNAKSVYLCGTGKLSLKSGLIHLFMAHGNNYPAEDRMHTNKIMWLKLSGWGNSLMVNMQQALYKNADQIIRFVYVMISVTGQQAGRKWIYKVSILTPTYCVCAHNWHWSLSLKRIWKCRLQNVGPFVQL